MHRPFAFALLAPAVAAAMTLACGARSSLEAESLGEAGASATTTSTTSTSTSTSATTTSTSTTTTTTTTSTTTTTTTTSTTTPEPVGCADGAREGFLDTVAYPDIAACSGGFQIAGLLGELAPACDLAAGDDGPNPNGAGCSAADLCAAGWHVCASAPEVEKKSPTGCAGAAPSAGLFFATRQSSPGCGMCATGTLVIPECGACQCVSGCLQTDATANDVFGCGTMGSVAQQCGVLDRFSNNQCGDLSPPWSCGGDGCNEAHAVSKPGPQAGGVLCCRS